MTKTKAIFQGAGVAIVTPFSENGVDFDKLTELLNRQIEAGTDAIIITGTTGEASTMPDEEHLAVIRHAVKVVGGRIPVIAGTGSNDTRHGIRLSQNAQSAGADALLCVTPYYNKTNQRGLIEHFKATAEAVDLPIILYNVPSRTNLNIAPATYQALMSCANIVGIKECNIHQLADTFNLCGDRYSIYSGEDGLVIPLMSLGGKGVISVVSNVCPTYMVEMTHAWLAGKTDKAAAMQIKLSDLVSALFCDVNPIPVKAAMNFMGLEVGDCRLPLTDVTEAQAEQIKSALSDFGLPVKA